MIIFYILGCVITFFIWALIHELSHLLMANLLIGVKDFEMRLYPHKYTGGLRWASCKYSLKRIPTQIENLLIYSAPRIPDTISAILFSILPIYFSGQSYWFGAIFLFGGIIDNITGLIGKSASSDIKRISNYNNNLALTQRLVGAIIILTSVMVHIVLR